MCACLQGGVSHDAHQAAHAAAVNQLPLVTANPLTHLVGHLRKFRINTRA
jgi:hypothetical protein